MRFLRSNTAVIVTVGPFYDKTDGVTIEGSLTITNERITLTADTDAGSAPTNVLDNVTGATSGTSNDLNYISGNDAGMMQLELAAADVNRVGRMFLSITDAANHVPVFHEFFVLPQAIYDWLTGVIVPLPSNITQIDGQATNGNNATLNLKQLNIVNSAGTALVASSTGSNGHGIAASGNGSGEGISATGGATGNGVEAIGGASSGSGAYIRATASGWIGLWAEGSGSGPGIYGLGGATGPGIEGHGGASSGHGLYAHSQAGNGRGIMAEGQGAGAGIGATGGATADGIKALGGATSGAGLRVDAQGSSSAGLHMVGFGGGPGFFAQGGATGHGLEAHGGATSGDGFRAEGEAGNSRGFYALGQGSASGFEAVGGATGDGIRGTGGATSGAGISGGATLGSGLQCIGTGASGIYAEGDGASGIEAIGGGDGHGLAAIGSGSGEGIWAQGGATGHGIEALGGATSGDGIHASAATAGDGIEAVGAGGGADINADITGSLTGTIGGLTAAALKDFFDTDSTTTYAGAVAGSVVKEIADNAGGASLTVQDIVDGVWDETRAGHAGAGSFGEGVASVQGNVTGNVSGNVTGSIGSVSAGGITAASIANGAIDAATFAADVDAEILSYLVDDATRIDASALNTASVTTIPAIVADTNELQTDWTDGGRLDLILDARASQASVDTIDDFVDTEIADILEDTSVTLHDAVDDLEGRLTAALAAALQAHALGIGQGIVDSGSTTTAVVFKTVNGAAPSATNDFYNGRHIVFTSGTLTLQATSITDYTGASATALVPALTGAPAEDVSFIIV